MSLLDEITAGTVSTGPGCSTCDFITDRPPAEVPEWDKVMSLPVRKCGNRAIFRAMKTRGFTMRSETSIIDHRQQRHRQDGS